MAGPPNKAVGESFRGKRRQPNMSAKTTSRHSAVAKNRPLGTDESFSGGSAALPSSSLPQGRMRSASTSRLLLAACLVYTLSVLSGGCAHIQRLLGSLFDRPTLHFQAANVRDLSLGGLTLDLIWKVENPNDVALRLDKLSYAFDIDGRRLTSGVQPKGIEMAARSSSSVSLPFEVRFVDLAGSVLSLLQRDEIDWKAEGSMGFETPAGMLNLPFSREGSTSLPSLPEVELAGASVSNLSLSGVTFNIELGLHNPNAFPVPLDGLSYALRVAGQDVASGNARPPRLEANRHASFSIPVRLSFAETGQAVYHAIQSGSADVGIRGELASGPLDLPLDLSRRVNLR